MSPGCPKKDFIVVPRGLCKLGLYRVLFWSLHNCLSFRRKPGKVTCGLWVWRLLPTALLPFLLQPKTGILIAQPQFLIRDAQKGDGLFISSDHEVPWTWAWLLLDWFLPFFARSDCLCAHRGVIMQTLAVQFRQVKPSIMNTYQCLKRNLSKCHHLIVQAYKITLSYVTGNSFLIGCFLTVHWLKYIHTHTHAHTSN